MTGMLTTHRGATAPEPAPTGVLPWIRLLGDGEFLVHPVGVVVGEVADQFVVAGGQCQGYPADAACGDAVTGTAGAAGGRLAQAYCVHGLDTSPLAIATRGRVDRVHRPGADLVAVERSTPRMATVMYSPTMGSASFQRQRHPGGAGQHRAVNPVVAVYVQTAWASP